MLNHVPRFHPQFFFFFFIFYAENFLSSTFFLTIFPDLDVFYLRFFYLLRRNERDKIYKSRLNVSEMRSRVLSRASLFVPGARLKKAISKRTPCVYTRLT